jgi:hypothetical protein
MLTLARTGPFSAARLMVAAMELSNGTVESAWIAPTRKTAVGLETENVYPNDESAVPL